MRHNIILKLHFYSIKLHYLRTPTIDSHTATNWYRLIFSMVSRGKCGRAEGLLPDHNCQLSPPPPQLPPPT